MIGPGFSSEVESTQSTPANQTPTSIVGSIVLLMFAIGILLIWRRVQRRNRRPARPARRPRLELQVKRESEDPFELERKSA
jgi:hypothetical protein